MNKSLVKFTNQLKELLEKNLVMQSRTNIIRYFLGDTYLSDKEAFKQMEDDIKSLLVIFAHDLKELEEVNILFNDWKTLSVYLDSLSLNNRDKFEVIMHVIKFNLLKISNLTDIVYINPDDIINIELEHISHKDFIELLVSGDINTILNGDDLNSKDNAIKEEITSKMPLFLKPQNTMLKLHKFIKEHYLDKEDSFTKKDIKYVTLSLKHLGLSDKTIESVEIYLNSIVDKRSKLANENTKPIVIEMKKSEVNYVTDSEYRALKKELNSYYNLYKGTLMHPLSKNEYLRVLEILIRLDVNHDELKRVSNLCVDFKDEYDPLVRYFDNKEKLEYYFNEDDLADIHEIEKVILSLDDKDLNEWVELLEDELTNLIHKFYNHFREDPYQYEISLATSSLEKKLNIN